MANGARKWDKQGLGLLCNQGMVISEKRKSSATKKLFGFGEQIPFVLEANKGAFSTDLLGEQGQLALLSGTYVGVGRTCQHHSAHLSNDGAGHVRVVITHNPHLPHALHVSLTFAPIPPSFFTVSTHFSPFPPCSASFWQMAAL